MRFTVGSASDVGRLRTLNEDSLLVGSAIFAVADGMGGHRGGEVASARALDALRGAFSGDGEPDDFDDLDALVAAVQGANRSVFEMALVDPELAGMGTTLCAVAVVATPSGQRLGVVNVGDSRVYLYSGDNLVQLSEDHSFVEALVRDGRLTRAQADVHPQRNVLTRALGIEPEVQIDAWAVMPRDGDRFLLCSDGLFNEVNDDELAEVLALIADPVEACDELVRRANESGGRDNITCVIVDVSLGDGTESTETPGDSDRVVRRFDPTDDLADYDDDELSAAAAIATETEPDVAAPATQRPQRSSRWRSIVFITAVVATIAIAFGAVAWAARSPYFVGFDRGQVVIYQGRPGGLLWFKPTIRERTDVKQGAIKQGEINNDLLDELRKGKVERDLGAARVFVSNIRGRIATTTTTTTSPEPTTTVAATPSIDATPATEPTVAPPATAVPATGG